MNSQSYALTVTFLLMTLRKCGSQHNDSIENPAVTAMPLQPTLTVTYSDNIMLAHCTAVVSNVSDVLTWVLATPVQTWNWHLGDWITTSADLLDSVSVKLSNTSHNERGTIMTSEMNITLGSTLEGATVACYSVYFWVNNSDELLENGHLRSKLHILPSFESQPPKLTYNTTEESDNKTLYMFTCDAFVGGGGVLTWFLRIEDVMATWKVTDDLDVIGEVPDVKVIENIATTATYDLNQGSRITSTIAVDKNLAVENTTSGVLACFSYDAPRPGEQLDFEDSLVKVFYLGIAPHISGGPTCLGSTAKNKGQVTIHRLVMYMIAPVCLLLMVFVACQAGCGAPPHKWPQIGTSITVSHSTERKASDKQLSKQVYVQPQIVYKTDSSVDAFYHAFGETPV